MAETALRPPVACESASALMRRKHDLLARVAYQVKEGDMLFISKKKLAVPEVAEATLFTMKVPVLPANSPSFERIWVL